MALLFVDSFDHYVTADLAAKYASVSAATIVAAAGRRASGALRLSADAVLPPLAPSGTVAIVGVAAKVPSLTAAGSLATIRSAGTIQCSVGVNASGFATVWRGPTSSGTLLATATTGAVLAGTFYYVEWKVTIHPSAGTAIVRINEAEVLNVTGLNTAASGVASWDTGSLRAQALNNDYDDFYVLDASGAAPLNTFLGDCRVDVRVPTAAGATTGWTPSTGANWAAVDDATPNGDTDYVSAAAAGPTDTYTVQDAPVPGGLLYGVQHVLSVKKSDAGTCSVAPVVRHSGVDYPATAVNPSTTYTFAVTPYGLNPGTGAAWTEADFNAAEFGVKRTA